MNIETADLAFLATRTSQYPTDNLSEFLLIGRSNVGKSSFINTVINRKNYARTSSKPGKTQTLNFYLINKSFYLVDAPGYGYADVNKQQQKKFGLMIEEYLRSREDLERVFFLIDYRHKPTEDDRLMYDFLNFYNIPITIIATKYDKVKKSMREKHDKLIKDGLKLENFDNLIYFSAINKKGRDEVYEVIKMSIENGECHV